MTPDYKGPSNWADDDIGEDHNKDEDLTQCPNCYKIFVIDGPGYGGFVSGLPYTSGFRFSYKTKFHEWVQIKIGSKWYVCSPYLEWRTIMHVIYSSAVSHWIKDTSKTNEVVTGTISGFANTWSEN